MSRSNSNGRCVFATISIVREGEKNSLVESYYKHVIQKKNNNREFICKINTWYGCFVCILNTFSKQREFNKNDFFPILRIE